MYLRYLISLLFAFVSNVFSTPIRGVNIGGWLVLEPWITPSLFYQFLGSRYKIGMDMYSFCEILGPVEANKQLKQHWQNWITNEHIQTLKKEGINLLRVPIGDWMYIPYGPYDIEIHGMKCADGAIDALDSLFVLAEQNDMQIMLDLHTLKGSQNGFDNSGESRKIQISGNGKYFTHWNTREANWIGSFDQQSKEYTSFDYKSIEHSKNVLKEIIIKYSKYAQLYGIGILNEPWEYTPESFLKMFYQDILDIFDKYMSLDKVFIFHDSFRSNLWSNFEFRQNESISRQILIDAHQYTAWNQKYESFDKLLQSTKGWQKPPSTYNYVIGEWSLAIDNCEMWLNGFMDNVDGYPLFPCQYKKCPKYQDFRLELLLSKYGPFGTGVSYPIENYECPVSISFQRHFDKSMLEKEYAIQLFESKSAAFEKETAGWIFWNFRTESSSYQWDYLAYIEVKNGLIKEREQEQEQEQEQNKKQSYKYIRIWITISFVFLLTTILLLMIFLWDCNKKRQKQNTLNTNIHYKPVTYKSVTESTPLIQSIKV